MTLVFSPQYRLVMQLASAKARDRKPDSGISLPKIERRIPAIANYVSSILFLKLTGLRYLANDLLIGFIMFWDINKRRCFALFGNKLKFSMVRDFMFLILSTLLPRECLARCRVEAKKVAIWPQHTGQVGLQDAIN